MKIQVTAFFFFLTVHLSAQELYPNSEPASTMPKGALGIRFMNESFLEKGQQYGQPVSQWRNQFAFRVMYGIGSKLSAYIQTDFSNHHDSILPRDLLYHTHNGNQVTYYDSIKPYGREYPYLFGGFYVYAKYRFLSHDEQQKHFRMAVYAEGSTTNVAHDEGEPGLTGDTKGVGGGVIITQLLHRFSATFTGGITLPGSYHEHRYDPGIPPPDGPDLITGIQYGKALNYNLSFGYLLYPSVYRDYKQININIYLELVGRSYEAAKIARNGNTVVAHTPTLQKGNYVNAVPGVQAIINSNTRIDFSAGFNLVQRSYRYFYPFYLFGIQHYFYFSGKKK